MQILDDLKTGGGRRQEFEDFVGRYDQGEPWDGIGEDEAISRHDELAGSIPPDEYEEAARASFERLSPEQRKQVGRQLKEKARSRNVQMRELDDADDDRLGDAGTLAKVTRGLQEKQPGMLGQLLGGGAAGNPLVKGALGGIAAMAAKRFMGR